MPTKAPEIDDESIYQPFSNNNTLKIPCKNNYDRNSISSRDSQFSTSSKSSINSKKSSSLISDDMNSRKSSLSTGSNSPSPVHQSNITKCPEPNCEICLLITHQKRQEKFQVVDGEVGDPSHYNPQMHSFNKNLSGKNGKPKDPTKVKPHFAKKLKQLDGTMKIIAKKVDQNVWEEKYEEAQKLQDVLVWLRKVDKKLKQLLYDRETHVNNGDYLAAQKAKDDYETALNEAVNLNSIQPLLSPSEYSALLNLKYT